MVSPLVDDDDDEEDEDKMTTNVYIRDCQIVEKMQ
jgi:hypothetical protein